MAHIKDVITQVHDYSPLRCDNM